MACHILDPVFWGLKLMYPSKVQGSSTLVNTESAPNAEVVQYTFPARKDLEKVKMPEVKVTWWDGGLLPPRPEELGVGEIMGRDGGGGCLFVGSKKKLMCGVYAKHPWILGDEGEPDVPKTIPRINTSHEMDFVRACKDGYEKCVENNTLPSSNFDYSGPLNEMVVMGVNAVRLQDLRRELEWDGEKMEFTNISESDLIKIVVEDDFEIIDGDPKFRTEYTKFPIDAKTFAQQLINKPYKWRWRLPDMPKNI
jgi:hypothetical protein